MFLQNDKLPPKTLIAFTMAVVLALGGYVLSADINQKDSSNRVELTGEQSEKNNFFAPSLPLDEPSQPDLTSTSDNIDIHDLRLITVHLDDANIDGAFAVIAQIDSGSPELLRINDRIGDAVLVDIDYTRVLLEQSGDTFSLSLVSNHNEDPAEDPMHHTTAPAPLDKFEIAQQYGIDMDAEPELPPQNLLLDQRRLLDWAGEPLVFASSLQVSPVSDIDGNADGIRVDFIEPGSAASQLGLTEGDTITSVNGIALASALDIELIHRAIDSKAATFSVQFRRGARTFSREFRFDHLSENATQEDKDV